MIEVNLFSISSTDPTTAMTGRCIARSRFSKESMGVSIMEYVKDFLKDNLDTLETAIGNADLVSIINSDQVMTTKDFFSIQYYLGDLGYTVKIWNVADDEVNELGIPEGSIVEWNVIDRSFIQYDYPTATKIVPGPDEGIADILKNIVEQSGLFDSDKFNGIKNPFSILVNNLKQEQETMGNVNPGICTRLYALLSQLGIDIFCATSEH
jgi:hypothetical protein